MGDPEINIIMPVHNVERWLSNTVGSVLAQSFSDFELILIDDGSTDDSGKICDRYASIDDRIIIIHQENKGVSSARNAGLKKMTGRYFMFIDADDRIKPMTLDTLWSMCEKNKAQVSSCGMVFFDDNEEVILQDGIADGVLLSNEEIMNTLLSIPAPFSGSCCNKLFSSSSWNGLLFDNRVRFGEDWLFLCTYLSRCANVAMTSKELYCVNVWQGSSSRTNRAKAYLGFILEGRYEALVFLINNKPQYASKAAIKYFDDCVRYWTEAKALVADAAGKQEVDELKRSRRFVLIVALKLFLQHRVSADYVLKTLYLLYYPRLQQQR